MGTPVISCASAGLNIEQGSICALGDCGCVSLLPVAADAGVGVAALALSDFEEELPHEVENRKIAITAKHKIFFIE
jgi:hypothetical protein